MKVPRLKLLMILVTLLTMQGGVLSAVVGGAGMHLRHQGHSLNITQSMTVDSLSGHHAHHGATSLSQDHILSDIKITHHASQHDCCDDDCDCSAGGCHSAILPKAVPVLPLKYVAHIVPVTQFLPESPLFVFFRPPVVG